MPTRAADAAIFRAAAELRHATRDLTSTELRATLLATVAEAARRDGPDATATDLEAAAAQLRAAHRKETT